jgi:DNA-binding response OmpR family regulator
LETVLVLENEPVAKRAIGALLRAKGYSVMEATSAAGAMKIARSCAASLDILIAGDLLRAGGGVLAAVDLFETCPAIAVLFVSGTPAAGWRSRNLLNLQLLPRTNWEFLQKPFEPAALDRRVRQLLDRRRPAAYSAAASAESSTFMGAVNHATMEPLLRTEVVGTEAMTQPNLFETRPAFRAGSFPVHIPEIAFCEEKIRLMEGFLSAIHELTDLQSQQTRAVIDGDPDFSRFDMLIHMASDRKDEAKYALLRHIETHHCEEG